jgi:hypothetical protein
MLDALITLSEGRTIDPQREAALIARGPAFTRSTPVEFVVIDRKRASPGLQAFAMRAFHLKRIDGDAQFDLYVPEL